MSYKSPELNIVDKIVTNIDRAITDNIGRNRANEQKIDRVILEEDFIPYIVPNIYIGRSNGNKLSFREGNESFLNVI